MPTLNDRKKIEYREEKTRDDLTPCHICTSHSRDTGGYPVIKRNKKLKSISRYIYEEHFGEIQKGKTIRHKCDNRACINIEHLEIGTQKDNVYDTLKRGRHTSSKLNMFYVIGIKICLAAGMTQRKIAELYGVNPGVISDIKTGKKWKWIDYNPKWSY